LKQAAPKVRRKRKGTPAPRRARARDGRDLEIARRIQTSILPRRVDVEGIEISAGMVPAEAVGGDYYDVLPVAGGCWIGIGDVAGHGLGAGLIMVMIQSMVMTLVRANEKASPREVVTMLNRLLHENIRGRLNQDDHVTFCLLRYGGDGQVTFAGAHEEILLWRTNGKVERIATKGTWLGAVRDIEKVTEDQTLQLHPGDLMILYTDGLIEARNEAGKPFGFERLAELVERHRTDSAHLLQRQILARLRRWRARNEDDVTVIVVRCQGVYWNQ
jgi:sigma-B regulation protein RsbU (phosphoserine phosphatase)